MNRQLALTFTLAATTLATSTAAAAPPTSTKVPAPFSGCSYVRGITTDDVHTNATGNGHTLHGNGWGYGHGCGDGSGGNDGGPTAI
jgi:hypothetical protein